MYYNIIQEVNIMGQSTISVRMDENLKKQFDEFCTRVGMNPSVAINMFANVVVREQRIPFEIALKQPNPQTIAAMEEANRISGDPSVKSYDDAESMIKDILKDA